jgi:hypothetical protein
MANNTVTEAQIIAVLNSNPKAVERAMVVLYDRQTADEKATSTTRHHNQRGFSGSTDKRGTYYARWVLGGRRLTGHHLDKARQIALKHRRQLVEEANLKAEKKAVPAMPRVQENRYMGGDIRPDTHPHRFVTTSHGTLMRC